MSTCCFAGTIKIAAGSLKPRDDGVILFCEYHSQMNDIRLETDGVIGNSLSTLSDQSRYQEIG